ncbi:calpain-like protein [Colletotrichum truncatum]|uniref:Calpain-like protein n=1 Tax=Colletotrichum truncatum TaxID=5467 RepID=A0ACC3ZDM9_COLTU|nr:calpain-like protein [Colletotrichum truncatum]KAF6794696.1 calpain-like protein [Colletotrichum truncatum]
MAYSPSSGSSSGSLPVIQPGLDQTHRQTYLTRMPLTISKPRRAKQQSPQDIIDEFWANFTTKTPGKATTIIPQNEYTEKIARRPTTATGVYTQTSYVEAATVCRAKVDKIVQECRRVNQKYRDPHFDLEFDLKFGRRDCLESLWNTKDKDNRQPSFMPKSVKRVVDIFDNPQFYIDGPTANDVRQGRDGDCWLMAALCNLSNKPGLIEKVCVAHDQDVGVYGFVFHRDGEWFSEIIDDKLYLTKPDYDEGYLERILWEDRERVNSEEAYRRIYQSNSGALYFAQCENPNETWLPLLEKAFAKAHGDYASIEGGFTGEAIEDLTGGVTSEIYTTDILDKEFFWKEKLLKVNQECLLGCSTGFASRGWGERKGIIEMHAYSVMKAIEMNNERLVLLKNPWGKGEWKGAWSDGSKEWTPEWLQKLNHKFGDDGAFWISYQDLLKKYSIFDVTRLFGADWKVTSIWTTLSVPWTLDYHDTHFAFTLSRPGPIVLVLAQLDDRYFRGLEGQYRFDLQFRVHKAGQEDYVVRSQASYRMNRSVNVELELEAGMYEVLVRLDAVRNDHILPVEQVVRNNAKSRREKLIRIGLAYDLAHSKGKVIESPEEKAARETHEKQEREKKRAEIKHRIQVEREQEHYLRIKALKRNQKQMAKRNARQKSRVESMRAGQVITHSKPEKRPDTGTSHAHPTQLQPMNQNHAQSQQIKLNPGVLNTPGANEVGKGNSADSGSTQTPKMPLQPASHGDRATLFVGMQAEKTDKLLYEPPNATQNITRHAEISNLEMPQSASSMKSESRHTTPDESEETRKESSPPSDVSEQVLCESEDDSTSVSSLSELSERELEIEIEAVEARECMPAGRVLPASSPPVHLDDQDELERDPWNAVAVVGLRVYYKVSSEHKDEAIVELRVVRPNPFAEENIVSKDVEPRDKKPKGLDVDDSAKDATLEGEIKQRKKSIAPTSEDLCNAPMLAMLDSDRRTQGNRVRMPWEC